MSSREAIQSVRSATVAIAALAQPGGSHPFRIMGTGFCVDTDGVIVTCRHVVEGFMSKSFAEQFPGLDSSEPADGQTGQAVQVAQFYAVFFVSRPEDERLYAFPVKIEALSADRKRDLAACRIGSHAAFSEGYPVVGVADFAELREGDEVMTCGFPLGEFLFDQVGTPSSSLTRGIISAVVPSESCSLDILQAFQLNLTATNGNSGGPVFRSDTGEVFGVLQGGVVHMDGSVIQGLSRAEPVYPMLDATMMDRLKQMSPEDHPGR